MKIKFKQQINEIQVNYDLKNIGACFTNKNQNLYNGKKLYF